MFDTIVDTCEVAYDFLNHLQLSDFYATQQHLTIIRGWEEKVQEVSENEDPYSSVCTRLEAFWRTLIVDAIGDIRATNEVEHMFNVWSGRTAAPKGERNFTEPYVSVVEKAANNRRFGISSRRYMGLTPAETEIGNLICVLAGGRTPFVLRENGDHFFLVGAC